MLFPGFHKRWPNGSPEWKNNNILVASWPLSSTDATSLSFSYSSVRSLHPFKPQWKMAPFPNTIAQTPQTLSSWPIMKSHTHNAWLQYLKNKNKKATRVLKNVACSHFLWTDVRTDRRASLPFMQPINIFSRISTIPWPRSITALLFPWMGSTFASIVGFICVKTDTIISQNGIKSILILILIYGCTLRLSVCGM